MITNFFRILVPSSNFTIQRIPYAEDKLAAFRREHNRNASFFRSGDFIYVSPRVGFDITLGEKISLLTKDSTAIVHSLIRHLIFREFRDEFPDRVPESFSPLRFYSNRPQHDPIRSFLPDDLKDKISFKRLIEVEARQISENGQPSFGLLIRSRQRWQFNIALDRLDKQKFELVGKSVLESVPVPGLEGVLAPDETLLGEIVAIKDDVAEINTNDGLVQRPLNLLHLQRTRSQIGAFLDFALGNTRATKLFAHLKEDSKDRQQPGASYSEALSFAKWFSEKKAQPRIFKNGDGFSFSVSRNNRFGESSMVLHPTNLIFDYGPGASERSPFIGLAKHGPFDAGKFERNDLKMLVISHQQSRGAVTQFLKLLIDGIPESRYFQRGLKSLFKLNSVQPVLKQVESSLPAAYEAAIDEAIGEADDRGFDIALIECPEGSRLVPIGENPYYRARARLMGYGIPTQGVRDQHLRSAKDALQWTLGPMALQLYAKVGGTPWRLPGTQSVDREIVIGVGHALERPNLWSGAEQSRVVGITTFFLGDGSYVLGGRLRSVPYSDYFEELLKALRISIENLAQEYAWKEGDSVRIVFHIFKPIKHVEADVVAQLVQSFPKFKILFAFVTISTDHPWMMFRGASTGSGKTSITLCERGDNLILDAHNCLLQIRGDRDRPNRKHRAPYPVSIRVHEKSTYKDLKFIVQQINDFSYLSWRSFFPSETPVTVFYSSLIASESNKLNRVPGWNPGFLETHFRRKQWFL